MLQTIAEQAREIIGAHQSLISMSIDENWTQVMEAVSFSEKHATRRQCKQTPDLFGIYTQVRRMQQPIRMTQAELVETRNCTSLQPPVRGKNSSSSTNSIC